MQDYYVILSMVLIIVVILIIAIIFVVRMNRIAAITILVAIIVVIISVTIFYSCYYHCCYDCNHFSCMSGFYGAYIGIMEKKMETTIVYWDF